MSERVKKWTKGEWERVSDETLYIRTSNGERVAMLTQLKGRNGMGGRRDRDEVRANSFVIAAAPALVEALEAAMDYINKSPCDPDITLEQSDAYIKLQDINPESALAAAYGETQ